MPHIENRVKAIVASTARLSPKKISSKADLRKLGIDSLVALELVAKLERAFRIRIPEGKIRSIGRVDQIVRTIQSLGDRPETTVPTRKRVNV